MDNSYSDAVTGSDKNYFGRRLVAAEGSQGFEKQNSISLNGPKSNGSSFNNSKNGGGTHLNKSNNLLSQQMDHQNRIEKLGSYIKK